MLFPSLETNRLRLIEITEANASEIFNIFSNEDVIRYYGMDSFHTMKQASLIIDLFSKRFQNKQGIRWGIVKKDTNEFIGTIGLNNLQVASKKAEIGYDLLPDFWRRGYVYEAIKEVITYSFQILEIYRIGAVTYPENEASSNLLYKAGFQKEGELRGYLFQNGQSHDAFIFSILKTDWNKNNT